MNRKPPSALRTAIEVILAGAVLGALLGLTALRDFGVL
jgi:hypothetical protein